MYLANVPYPLDESPTALNFSILKILTNRDHPFLIWVLHPENGRESTLR